MRIDIDKHQTLKHHRQAQRPQTNMKPRFEYQKPRHQDMVSETQYQNTKPSTNNVDTMTPDITTTAHTPNTKHQTPRPQTESTQHHNRQQQTTAAAGQHTDTLTYFLTDFVGGADEATLVIRHSSFRRRRSSSFVVRCSVERTFVVVVRRQRQRSRPE